MPSLRSLSRAVPRSREGAPFSSHRHQPWECLPSRQRDKRRYGQARNTSSQPRGRSSSTGFLPASFFHPCPCSCYPDTTCLDSVGSSVKLHLRNYASLCRMARDNEGGGGTNAQKEDRPFDAAP